MVGRYGGQPSGRPLVILKLLIINEVFPKVIRKANRPLNLREKEEEFVLLWCSVLYYIIGWGAQSLWPVGQLLVAMAYMFRERSN